MSVFNDLLQKISEISNSYTENIKNDLKSALEAIDKFESNFDGKNKAREQTQKSNKMMTTLQSIDEDEDEPNKDTGGQTSKRISSAKTKSTESRNSVNNTKVLQEKNVKEIPKRVSKKRSKDEVDEMSSPEADKRPKRNASVRAQSVISKQVNVNLTQKLRRDESAVEEQKAPRASRTRRKGNKEDDGSDKENTMVVKVKEEKISLPPEPMDTDALPINIEVKQESTKDDIAMPPPTAPVPKTRGRPPKAKQDKESTDKEREKDSKSDESVEETGRKRNTRNKKQTIDDVPPGYMSQASDSGQFSDVSVNLVLCPHCPDQRLFKGQRGLKVHVGRVHKGDRLPDPSVSLDRPVWKKLAASSRSMRASSRSNAEEPQPEPRPKRTRSKKKQSDAKTDETSAVESAPTSPEKSRPKRTRRGKAAEKEAQKQQEMQKEVVISPKEERISHPEQVSSPILQKDANNSSKEKNATKNNMDTTQIIASSNNVDMTSNVATMDTTMVLPNGKYDHAPVTPKNVMMNATVVIERIETVCRETMIIETQTHKPMDATVIIEKAAPEGKASNITDDNSLLTDDNSDHQEYTPPPPRIENNKHNQQPSSLVKEKVQQFEELASRVTRTKTRAMAKQEESTEEHTPDDKIGKAMISAETLDKMNSLLFKGKTPQISASASKPQYHAPAPTKATSSTSKLATLSKLKETAYEREREKEDARRKKEALLEAKRENQKRKREEKMAAAAAARSAAERERMMLLAAAARGREEKQAHAELGKAEKLKEVERKKQEHARKVAETEERRKVEERARQQRLAEEQRRAEIARLKQHEEAEAAKKEAALISKEMEKRQKEYIEKQKLKQKLNAEKVATPIRSMNGYIIEPVHMSDGFEHLNSDEEQETTTHMPDWSTKRARLPRLEIQSYIKQSHIDRLFSVRTHSPDLREIFPNIDRRALKRTSSAVWRTPPNHRLATVEE